jgi:hypothetical protein
VLKSSTCFENYTAHIQEVYVIIIYMQPLVSSLSAGDCAVHRLRNSLFYVGGGSTWSQHEGEDYVVGSYLNNDRGLCTGMTMCL